MSTEPAHAPPGGEEAPQSRRRAVVTMLIGIAVAVLIFGVVLPQLLDWGVVFDVLRLLDGSEVALIAVIAIVRFIPSGWLYSMLLPGLSIWRGVKAWVGTTALASSTPGFDIPLRFAMYSSWGFSADRTASNMALSGVVEISTKYVVAIVGIALWALVALDATVLVIALVGVAILAAIGVTVGLVLRSDRKARQLGDQFQRLVSWGAGRLSRQAPTDVSERVVGMRGEARDLLGAKWKQAFAVALMAELMVFLVVLMSIRAVGLDSGSLHWADVLLAYGVAVIATTIPITPGGLGIVEFVYVAILTPLAGSGSADLVGAGVILARVLTWLLPIPIGWIITLRWQTTTGSTLFRAGTQSG